MRHILSSLIFLTTSLFCFSQDINRINGFKYVYIPILEYNGGTDIFNISSTATNLLQDKGFIVIHDIAEYAKVNKEISNNPCLVLYGQIDHPNPNSLANSVNISFFDCNDQLVYKGKGTSAMGLDVSGDYRNATRSALSRIRSLKYSFNPTLTPARNLPSVETTSETEESIRLYLSTSSISPIEGIYKSYQNESLSYYKFGIIKKEDKYKAIIIECDNINWKAGEVKATFEPSSMKGLYSVKWYMGDKTANETFGTMENESLLSIELPSSVSEKKMNKFVKLYPLSSVESSIFKDSPKSSGSGFFVTTNGIIGTNAHVVENANNIEVTVINNVGNYTYKAKTVLLDSKNDVALIKIDDANFKGMNSLPYSILEYSDIGASVFTIGYPLNDVMGSNFKVTNGIISAQTGIEDDIRYYQITVPLQPGNSGGPLFNKDGNIIGLTTSRLNSEAIGTQVENVNYAIKSSYLLNLYNMLPNSEKLIVNSELSGKELQDQVKVLKDYVCLIRIF